MKCKHGEPIPGVCQNLTWSLRMGQWPVVGCVALASLGDDITREDSPMWCVYMIHGSYLFLCCPSTHVPAVSEIQIYNSFIWNFKSELLKILSSSKYGSGHCNFGLNLKGSYRQYLYCKQCLWMINETSVSERRSHTAISTTSSPPSITQIC